MIKNTNKFLVAELAILSVFIGFSAVPTAFATSQGVLEGRCIGNSIQLDWGSHPNANSNGLQKADVNPGDPNRFWDWLPTNDTQRSYTDNNITMGREYSYRVKYRPELPSNIVTLTCSNTPTPSQPTVNISANPSSVSYNGSSSIVWNSTNAISCTASGGTNGWAGNKGLSSSFYSGLLTSTTTYYITCTNSAGSDDDSVTVTVGGQQQNLPIVDITADDTSIDSGDSTTVRWTSNYATSCSASGGRNGWAGSKNTNSSFFTGSLSSDTTYSITCTNSYGSANDSVTVRVDGDDDDNDNEAPDVTTRAATSIDDDRATLNGRVDGNGLTTRAWFEYGTSRSNLDDETRERSYGSGSTSYDEEIDGLRANTTYYFRAVAENSEDTVYGSTLSFYTGSDNIYIPPVVIQPTVVLSADSTNLAYGGATTVRWYTNATSCFASGGSTGWAGAKTIGSSSFYTGSLTGSRTYVMTCTNQYGSATDSVTVNVRGQVLGTTTVRQPLTSMVLINSSVDRNQPIVPTLDNTRPHPGDEINYTVSYQNIGTGSITNLNLRVDLPQEVDYMFSNPNNPTRMGQTLIFNLGTLKANGQGVVTIRVRVRDNVPPGTNLNFPATLSYVDPSGYSQSVNANVSAQIWSEPINFINQNDNSTQGANVFWGIGFLPGSLFEWLFLLILILILIILAKYIFSQPATHTQVIEHR